MDKINTPVNADAINLLINFRLSRIKSIDTFLSSGRIDLAGVLLNIKKTDDVWNSFLFSSSAVQAAIEPEITVMLTRWHEFFDSNKASFSPPMDAILQGVVENNMSRINLIADAQMVPFPLAEGR